MRRLLIFGFFIFIVSSVIVPAEETDLQEDGQEDAAAPSNDPPEQNPRRKEGGRPIVLDINARVLEQDQIETLNNEPLKKTIIPSKPVEIKLVGSNLVVSMQFTYIRNEGQKFLVAQGQIWIDIPEQGIQYHYSMQTIPLEFDEPILFFPLGQLDENTACIEVELTLKRLIENHE